MKKILFMIVLMMIVISIQSFAGFENPFTDEDYLRDDFGIKDYEAYVTDSIDNTGIRWPEGTKIISSETSYMGKPVNRNSPIFVPDDIEILGHAAFMGRPITDEMIDFSRLTKLKYIGKYAFCDTSLHRVDLSKTQVVRIGAQAFESNTVTAFIAPPTLKRIDEFVAPHCVLGVLKLNEGLEYIGAEAFSSVSLNTITIPSTVKYIGQGAFPLRATFDVAKGSYAEEWCKNNGLKYTYHTEKKTIDENDVRKIIGPLKFTKYFSHSFRERQVTRDNRLPVITVHLATDGSIETIYDNVELYKLPADWDINSPYVALTDKGYTDYYGRPKVLSDDGINPYPTVRMNDGWKKGLKWEIAASRSFYIAAKFNGKIYYYNIENAREKQYLEYKTTGDSRSRHSGEMYASSTAKIISDNKEFNCEAYNIFGNNFFKLRDVACMISGSPKQFQVLWNEKAQAVEIGTNSPYSPVGGEVVSGDGQKKRAEYNNPMAVFCDGYEVFLEMYNIAGNNYIKLRDIGKLLDFGVNWSDEDKCIIIDTSSSYIG